MLTHFVRRAPKGSARPLSSPVESLVLQAVPSDRLLTANGVYEAVAALALKEGERPPPRQGLENLLEGLAKGGHVYEVHPQRIKKMLEQIP